MRLTIALIAVITAVTQGCVSNGAAPAGEAPNTGGPVSPGVPSAEPPPSAEAAPPPDRAGYRAAGNEPFWALTFSETGMTFSEMGNTTTATAARPDAERTGSGWRFTTTTNGNPFIVEVEDRICSDSMSGGPYPHSVSVRVAGRSYTGCGGDTAALLAGNWRATVLETAEASSLRAPTMSCEADGIPTGDGGCNRYRSMYEITGNKLALSPAVATRRACGEAELNSQETQFLNLLPQVTRLTTGTAGELELMAGDQLLIRAVRQ